MSDEERTPEKPHSDSRRGLFFAISALGSGLLSGLASERLSQSLDSGGWVRWAGIGLTLFLGLFAAVYNAPTALQWFRRWRRGVVSPTSAEELHTAAEEAEQWMTVLGSEAGGIAAAEWYSLNEDRLRELLLTEKARDDTVDDFARICDALEAWYVRRADPGAMLQLSELLSAAAEACNRRDLSELGAARAATARRLGQLGDPQSYGGRADDSTPGRTSLASSGPSRTCTGRQRPGRGRAERSGPAGRRAAQSTRSRPRGRGSDLHQPRGRAPVSARR